MQHNLGHSRAGSLRIVRLSCPRLNELTCLKSSPLPRLPLSERFNHLAQTILDLLRRCLEARIVNRLH